MKIVRREFGVASDRDAPPMALIPGRFVELDEVMGAKTTALWMLLRAAVIASLGVERAILGRTPCRAVLGAT